MPERGQRNLVMVGVVDRNCNRGSKDCDHCATQSLDQEEEERRHENTSKHLNCPKYGYKLQIKKEAKIW